MVKPAAGFTYVRKRLCHGKRLIPGILTMLMRPAVILKSTRIWRYLAVLLCACVALLHTEEAFCATNFQAPHGSWVIVLEEAKKEDLLTYFGESDEQDLLAKASSTVFTFDINKMSFTRSVLGEKTVLRIKNIEKSQSHPDLTARETQVLWLEGIKFPDYILALPDGRLRYGSSWGRPWEFILQRK